MRPDALRTIADLTRREQAVAAGGVRYAGPGVELPDKLGAIDAATTALREAGVGHALIGGLGVGIRSGVPRAKLGVDFAIDSGADREATSAALASHGCHRTGVFRHSMNFVHASGEPVQLPEPDEGW